MLNENETVTLTGDTEDISVLQHDYNLSELALVFPNVNSMLIPKKAAYTLGKYASKTKLKEIDPNIEVAVEKCLVVLSNLASTHYTDERWKALSAEILHEQTKTNDNTFIYKKIVTLLQEGTSNGPLVEVDDNYGIGVKCKKYRIADRYFDAGLTEYQIQDKGIVQRRNKLFYQQLSNALENPICANLVKVYPKIELPTSEELLVIGKRLAKEGYTTRKGKILTVRNRHKNHYWTDAEKRSFVEDNIRLFEFLTSRGFMIPTAGDQRSGGRVVDSFTLMPAWIREQITIDGKTLSECDYTALHPNIAVKLYGGSQSYITHQNVAEMAAIGLKEVKTEHLAFFNRKWNQMVQSPLFAFYSKHENQMLEKIFRDKKDNGYKVTSMRMFKAEVGVMTDVIRHLSSKGIYVLYVYDALVCEMKDVQDVIQTMNRTILEHGIKTHVKAKSTTEVVTKEPILPKFGPDDEVNLYQVLSAMSLSSRETMLVIGDLDRSVVKMKELVAYINKQNKEQKYNDYNGVDITAERIGRLKGIIAA